VFVGRVADRTGSGQASVVQAAMVQASVVQASVVLVSVVDARSVEELSAQVRLARRRRIGSGESG
jgi:hypothetical protein